MYLNTFKNTFKYFFKKKSSTLKKKKLANTVETLPKWLAIFMFLLKQSLHYHLFIIEKNMTVK